MSKRDFITDVYDNLMNCDKNEIYIGDFVLTVKKSDNEQI